ncbi:MAG: phosphoglycerate dehydrogenase [Planctomycetia bacterium]|nr:MAG: phosphoglycerate dehydrogenase [Planctomycetia bacterium]RIK70542.1 MAG: phosphoglycerate dehydrogenase [Planctomycetota bacterium]
MADLKVLVADKIAEEGLARLRATQGLLVDVRTGLSPADLAAIVGDYDGLIIRSGVKVTAEVFAKPGRLRVIARAGVGVDNVDVPAATAAGVLVMNTPDANTISTAEHTMAMLLALMHRIPDAHAHVRNGAWDRAAFVGRQLAGKTLGIVGLGRVGRAVAERALAFGMDVWAFDPFVSGETALDGAVRIAPSLDDLLGRVDCLTLHAALTGDNKHLIGAAQLARMKPSAVLVNCARGALVDESALADALNSGRLAGAAIDVFANEPPVGSPLPGAKNIVLTPHLGASTAEAQTAVSTDAVDELLDYLLHGRIRGAVNVAGLPANLTDRDRAYLDLTARMAAVLAPFCADGVDRVLLATHGEQHLTALCPTLALQALAELMSPHIEGRLNLVNAAAFARQRGIDVQNAAHSAQRDYLETVTIEIERRGAKHAVEGAVFVDGRPRILAIDGYRMEMVPEGPLVLIFNDDRPGVIGVVGTLFGDRQINIADMFLSRRDRTALMVLRLDAQPPAHVLDALRAHAAIVSVQTVALPPLR